MNVDILLVEECIKTISPIGRSSVDSIYCPHITHSLQLSVIEESLLSSQISIDTNSKMKKKNNEFGN